MIDKAALKELATLSKDLLKKDLDQISYDVLVEVLQKHEKLYYIQNDPIISDKEYDQLFDRLQQIEASGSVEVRKDSPSQRVSSDLNSDFLTVPHIVPMLSLANSYNADDLIEFDKQIRKLTGVENKINYFVEPKYDGGSVALVYENDFLIRAATRGNGTEGEEITANIKSLPSVPLKANFSKYGLQKVELRGEAVIAKSTFEKTNQKRQESGLALFANPRNAATGGLRMKNANETRERGLEVFVFQMAHAEDSNGERQLNKIKDHHSAIKILKELGFKVQLEKEQLCDTIEKAFKAADNWETNREKFEYEIDGAVIKVNDFSLQDTSGSTQHHPRWAIAYKFKAKQATTKLLAVEFQVGKTGAITPVAKVEAVHLAGVTVSSISLHNEEFIQQKDLRLGDSILIERAGDVIPYVAKTLDQLRDGSEKAIQFPENCPSCQTILVKSEQQAAWRCPNYNCPQQQLQRMIFHVSKDAMNIDGFGKSYILKFFELGWIKDISDIYNLDYEEIAKLEGFGSKSASNLKSAIDKASTGPIHRLLNSLSIHHLGKKASKLIGQEINHVLDLKNWNLDQYTEIKDIGPVVAENVISYFADQNNIALLERMEARGVNLTQTEEDKPKAVSEDAPLIGKTILFTGSLQTMSRKVAQAKAEEAGAKNISAVSSNLNILVVGEKAGSKLKKAEALGTVEILTEEAFNQLINS